MSLYFLSTNIFKNVILCTVPLGVAIQPENYTDGVNIETANFKESSDFLVIITLVK